jgi:hypothetical protein
MTEDGERQLFTDVAETKGMLNRFLKEWDERKPSIASCVDVDAVNDRLTEHINAGKHNSNLWPVWVASISAAILALLTFISLRIKI